MATYEKDRLILSTGRKLYASWGVFGISPDLIARHGFDGDVDTADDKLTPEERKELADYVIDLWQKYQNADTAPSPEPSDEPPSVDEILK